MLLSFSLICAFLIALYFYLFIILKENVFVFIQFFKNRFYVYEDFA